MLFPETNEASGAIARVLVVDDDPSTEATTLAALGGGGYPSVAESDGDAVLRMVRGSLTRLVVSEIYIPCSEGACVVTALKQDRLRLPRVGVLVHTRHTTAADTRWALAAGCDAVVPKSAGVAILLRELGRLDHEPPPPPSPPSSSAHRAEE